MKNSDLAHMERFKFYLLPFEMITNFVKNHFTTQDNAYNFIISPQRSSAVLIKRYCTEYIYYTCRYIINILTEYSCVKFKYVFIKFLVVIFGFIIEKSEYFKI